MTQVGFRQLLLRAQAGDACSFSELCEVVRGDLEQHARGYMRQQNPEASASDLVQKTLLRAWQKLHQFQCAMDDEQALLQFRAWTNRILNRLGLNTVREREALRRKPAAQLLRLNQHGYAAEKIHPAASDPSPSACAGAVEEALSLRKALDKADGTLDHVIIRLRFYEGLSLRQIAQRLELSNDKVREHYHRALRHLQRELKGLS